MKSLGFSTVPCNDIVTPPGFVDILKSPEAKARGESIQSIGVLEPIRVRKRDKKLVFGQHRLAGSMLAKIPGIPAELVDCTDAEMREAQIDENLERRVLSNEEIAQLTAEKVELIQARIEAASYPETRFERDAETVDNVSSDSESDNQGAVSANSKRGPKKTAKGKAIDSVAAKLDVSTRTVRRRLSDAEGDEKSPLSPPKGFEFWGVQLTIEQVEHVRKQVEGHKQLVSNLKTALKIAKGIPSATWADDFVSRLGVVLDNAETAVPVALCPLCKGHHRLVNICEYCHGSAMVGQSAIDACPPQYLDAVTPMVLVNGKAKKLAGL